MKYLLIFFIILISASCIDQRQNKHCGKFSLRNGISQWDNATIHDIDSVNMKSKTHAVIWINGVKQSIYADFMKVGRYSNCE